MSRTTKFAIISLLGMVCTGCSWNWQAIVAGLGAAGGYFEIAQLIGNLAGFPILPGV